jgi:hypothetical protein
MNAGDVDMIVVGGNASLTIKQVAIDNDAYGYIVRQNGGAVSLIEGSITVSRAGLLDSRGNNTLDDECLVLR